MFDQYIRLWIWNDLDSNLEQLKKIWVLGSRQKFCYIELILSDFIIAQDITERFMQKGTWTDEHLHWVVTMPNL
jgi:hypothetical protein